MLKIFSITDIGKKRKLNQDFVYVSGKAVGPFPNLFLVADGMGGHNAGDFASKLAVETIVETVGDATQDSPEKILREAIYQANRKVWEFATSHLDYEGMGTTVVAATYIDGVLFVANVGDSRLYIVGKQKIEQVTKDHSWVEEMVRRGGMAREEAKNHPDKNIITRAVGVEETVNIDFFTAELKKTDCVLMCTDGLTNMLDDEIIRMTMDGAGDVERKAEELVRLANEAGGQDNISVILIEQ